MRLDAAITDITVTIIEGSSPQFSNISINLIRKLRDSVIIIIIFVIITIPPSSHPRKVHTTLLSNLTNLCNIVSIVAALTWFIKENKPLKVEKGTYK